MKNFLLKIFSILKWETGGLIQQAVQMSKKKKNSQVMKILQRFRMNKMKEAQRVVLHIVAKKNKY